MNLMTQLIRLTVPICVWMSAFMHLESSAKPAAKNQKPALESSSVEKIRHVVCFKFRKTPSPPGLKSRERIRRLEKISGIRSLEWGKTTAPKGTNKGFTHCFIVTFDNEQSLEPNTFLTPITKLSLPYSNPFSTTCL